MTADGGRGVARAIVKYIVPVYVAVVLVILGSYVAYDWQLDRYKQESIERAASDREILLEISLSDCADRNHTKRAVRGIINAALVGLGPSDSVSVSLRTFRDTLLDEDCVAANAKLAEELLNE